MAKKANGGEWKSKLLHEEQITPTVSWAASISISPDGKKFVGVRKQVTRKDGSTITTRDGISLLYEKEKTAQELKALIKGFKKLLARVEGTDS